MSQTTPDIPVTTPPAASAAGVALPSARSRSGTWLLLLGLVVAVLALIILKIAAEFAVSLPLFARFASEGIQPVPLAHLAGVLAATYVQRLRFRSKLLGGRPR